MAVTPTRSNRTPGARAQAAGPYVVLAVALALSSGLTYYSRATVAATDRSRFENAVQVARDRIHTRLSTYMGMLRAGSGLMAAHPDTTAAQFREYVGRLTIERNYPGIQGIGFTRRCPPEERAALVAAMREVYGSFTIWPESERAEYHAIVYLEPLDRRNRAAIGYDMFSESVRRAAMERARDTGEPAASGIVTLVQEIDEKKQAGFLIYVPVYRGGAAPPTVERRRAELVGYVYSPFRVDDLLAGIFGTEATPRVGFRIYDADHVDPARLLYSGFDHAPRASDGLVTEMALDVAGRKWTLLFVPAAGLEAGSGRALVSLVLVLSMLASAGLFAFSRSQALARAAAESAAEDLAHLLAQHRRSEDELRTLIEVIPIGIGIARDPKCDVITHNPHFYRILGVPPGQNASLNASNDARPALRVTADGRELSPEELPMQKAAMLGREVLDVELQVATADGREITLVGHAAPLLDERGAVRGATGAFLDITARKHAEARERTARAEAEAASRRSELLASASLLLAGSRDVRERLSELVRSGASVLAEACAIEIEEPGEDGHRVRVVCVRRADGTLDDSAVASPPRESLQERGFGSFVSIPIKAGSSALGSLLLASRTAGRVLAPADAAAAEALAVRIGIAVENERLYAELVRRDRAKDDFLAMLAHELRNPLAAVSPALHLLVDPRVPASASARAREVLVRQFKQLERLVDDLLDVSRITRGKIELRRESVEVVSLVTGVVDDHRPALEVKRLALKLEAPAGPVWIDGDRARLAQIVGNLIGNSAKFTEPGGEVEVRVELRGDRAVLIVRDTGIGMSAATLKTIFRPFVQADRSLHRTRGGLGLGLAVVKALVSLHGGDVTAASEGEGRGSTITVELPLAAPPRVSAHERAPRDEAVDGGRLPVRLRVLVIEDNPDVAATLVQIIDLLGHDTTVAHDGPAGVDAARRVRPHLVLCDLGLPGKDGFAVAAELAAEPELEGTALVALSGYGQTEAKARAEASGFTRHFTKPVLIEDLEALLADVARTCAGMAGRDGR